VGTQNVLSSIKNKIKWSDLDIKICGEIFFFFKVLVVIFISSFEMHKLV
jgi:hypothetical protein